MAVARKGALSDEVSATATFKAIERPVQIQTGQETHAFALRQVPINTIFTAEFQALKIPLEKQKQIRATYEKYVAYLTNSATNWLKARGLRNSSEANESDLFKFISKAFNKGINPGYDDDSMLATSMITNSFNCYSSSILIADVLIRAGKNVNVVLIASGHMLLAGDTHALETTSKDPEAAVFVLSELSALSQMQEHGIECLLAEAHIWAGEMHSRNNKFEEALSEFEKAIGINVEYAEAWTNKGNALYMLERYEDAVSAYYKALKLNPKLGNAWHGIKIALEKAESAGVPQ